MSIYEVENINMHIYTNCMIHLQFVNPTLHYLLINKYQEYLFFGHYRSVFGVLIFFYIDIIFN